MSRRENDITGDWLPQGWTEEALQRTPSVLWEDGTALQDLAVLVPIVNHGFPSSMKGAKEASIERIMINIRRPEWQSQHPLRNFVFCYYYALQVRPVDIKTVVYAQALEVLCYTYFPDFETQDFAEKMKRVFRHIYQENITQRAAQMLRIMRNNTAHLADVTNTDRLARFQPQVMQDVIKFAADHYNGDTRGMFFSFSAAFNDLMEDIILRIIDGGIEDIRKYQLSAYMMFREGGME